MFKHTRLDTEDIDSTHLVRSLDSKAAGIVFKVFQAIALTGVIVGVQYASSQLGIAQGKTGATGPPATETNTTGLEILGEQLLALISSFNVTEFKGDQGEPGANGTSIKGDKGDPGINGTSIKGDKGDPGINGTSIKGDKGDSGAIQSHASYWTASQAVVTPGQALSFFGKSAESDGISQISPSSFYLARGGRYMVSYRSDTYESTAAAGLCLTVQDPLPSVPAQLLYFPQSATSRFLVGGAVGALANTTLSVTCFIDVPPASTLRLVAVPTTGTQFTPLNTQLSILGINSSIAATVPFNALSATMLALDLFVAHVNDTGSFMNATFVSTRSMAPVDLQSDETQPIADPYGLIGFHYRSPGVYPLTSSKINWYYANPVNLPVLFPATGGYRNVSELQAAWHTLTLYSSASVPYVIIYTKWSSLSSNAASWYKSKLVYTFQSGAVLPIGIPIVLYVGGAATQCIPNVTAQNYFPLFKSFDAQGSAGPQQLNEQIILISIQTNSGDAFAQSSFTLNRIALAFV